MKTKLTEMLGIEKPILLGAMAWIGTASLVAAVSNEGGAGVIGTGSMPPEVLRKEIQLARLLTDKPIGANIQMQSPFIDEQCRVMIEEGIDFATIGNGDPRRPMDALKNAGIKVLPIVPSLKLALRMEEYGADGIVLEGMEAGGHIGKTTTMSLLSMTVKEIKKVPVVIGGGIADGRGLAAALIMGADGIQMGTAFILAKECTVHPNYKQKIIECGDTDTIITGFMINEGMRGLLNNFTKEYLTKERNGVSREELRAFAVGSYARAALEGDIETGTVSCGQIAGMLNKETTVKEIMSPIVADAERILMNAAYLV